MAIPTFDRLFRPVLVLATQEPITRNSATEAMIKQHKLTPEEAAHRLPSGGLTIRNRVGWAMTFLTKAGLIEKVAPKTYKATSIAADFLKKHPDIWTSLPATLFGGRHEAEDRVAAAGGEKRRPRCTRVGFPETAQAPQRR